MKTLFICSLVPIKHIDCLVPSQHCVYANWCLLTTLVNIRFHNIFTIICNNACFRIFQLLLGLVYLPFIGWHLIKVFIRFMQFLKRSSSRIVLNHFQSCSSVRGRMSMTGLIRELPYILRMIQRVSYSISTFLSESK